MKKCEVEDINLPKNIGEVIVINNVPGYVVSRYEDNTPKWLMSVTEFGRGTWYEAIQIILPYGWIIPNKDELFTISYGILEMINSHLITREELSLGIWSSTEENQYTAWILDILTCFPMPHLKGISRKVFATRAFYKIEK